MVNSQMKNKQANKEANKQTTEIGSKGSSTEEVRPTREIKTETWRREGHIHR